jgi:hypothetical protein
MKQIDENEIIWLTKEQVELITDHYNIDNDIIDHILFGISKKGEVFVQLSDSILIIKKNDN